MSTIKTGLTILGVLLALPSPAFANAPPPPPPERESPADAVTVMHDTIAGMWTITVESLVGPEPDPKTGTLDLTLSGRYFLTLAKGTETAPQTDQGIWAVWDAAEGGSFVIVLAPISAGDGQDLGFGPGTPQRIQLISDGTGGYRGEGSYGTHLRKIELHPR